MTEESYGNYFSCYLLRRETRFTNAGSSAVVSLLCEWQRPALELNNLGYGIPESWYFEARLLFDSGNPMTVQR